MNWARVLLVTLAWASALIWSAPALAGGDGKLGDKVVAASASVVKVTYVSSGGRPVSGSGFVWCRPGQVVTALHLVAGGSRIVVRYEISSTSANF